MKINYCKLRLSEIVAHPIALLLGLLLTCGSWSMRGEVQDEPNSFARTTIDFGVVVSDLERSIKFYCEAIGFREVPGFDVPAGFAKDAGLTDGKPLSIKVLVLGEGEGASKMKLMQVSGVRSTRGNNRYIHSQFGFSYITLFVKDTEAALKRLKKAGVDPVAKGPVALPEDLAKGVYLTLVRDPDGNFVELVGPKAE